MVNSIPWSTYLEYTIIVYQVYNTAVASTTYIYQVYIYIKYKHINLYVNCSWPVEGPHR